MNSLPSTRASRRLPALLTVAWAACSLGLFGCSQSPCDRASTVYGEVTTKLKACTAYSPLTFDKATCSSGVKNCSSDDLKIFDNAMDCLEQLPTCEAGNEDAWGTEFQNCQSAYQVSSTCADAVGNH